MPYFRSHKLTSHFNVPKRISGKLKQNSMFTSFHGPYLSGFIDRFAHNAFSSLSLVVITVNGFFRNPTMILNYLWDLKKIEEKDITAMRALARPCPLISINSYNENTKTSLTQVPHWNVHVHR